MLGNKRLSASVPVKDIERAGKFYSETLGLRSVEIDAPATRMFESAGSSAITLYEREEGTRADHTARSGRLRMLSRLSRTCVKRA